MGTPVGRIRAILVAMRRLGQPAGDFRRRASLLEEILYTLAFLVLLFTGLFILTGGLGKTSVIASFIAVLFLVFGFYGGALKVVTLLDLFFPRGHHSNTAHASR